MSKKLVIYLPEGFADWEGSFLMPELVQNKKSFVTVSETGNDVLSIGRLKVKPEAALSSISIDEIEGLVLIGSDTWSDSSQNQKVLKLAGDLLKKGTLVAAICGATVAMAREGLLNERNHTSNFLPLLKQLVPAYRGEKNYKNDLAVTDGNLITASGVGALEFTMHLMRALNIYTEEKRQQWFALYKNGVHPPMEFWS
ncbi:DJ-1/PfpI family protein [Bdellovibrio sp. 22V]|uniref:DJ-1/PfpI family protein n=1 Tax=Bdellovibrio TaxID=958 RepID=UPI002542DC4F|nr:DJ-1/PfpI family protein [Bdellovibrio sp. 22V]WII72142.1 DJ-1/PfpI family protein [Bdellovibrio sp. 22V]